MGGMPEHVLMTELNLFWQDVFTFLSWAIAIAMLGVAIWMGRKQKTLFYVLAILAVGVGAFIEPLYDVAFDLWFFDVHNGEAGAMYSHFTAFGKVQPIWTHSGYIILYASACLYAGRAIYDGRLRAPTLFLVWLAEIAASCLFEAVGTGVGVYSYYGPYVLRIWNYPLVIAVLEGTQVVLFTILAVHLWRKVQSGYGLLGLFILFPITMMGANTGIGAPIIIALHLDDPAFSETYVWIATFATIAMCAVAVLGASKFLPEAAPSGERVSPVPQRGAIAT